MFDFLSLIILEFKSWKYVIFFEGQSKWVPVKCIPEFNVFVCIDREIMKFVLINTNFFDSLLCDSSGEAGTDFCGSCMKYI